MPQILTRQIDESIVRELRAEAAAEGVSAGGEARRILRCSLVEEVPDMSLADFLRAMPAVGGDEILARPKLNSRRVAL